MADPHQSLKSALMVFISCITLLLLSTVILADYYIDNGNTSVVYHMPPSQSWKAWSVSSGNQKLPISNSTGTYTIPLDASNCYDQNYTQGKCGTGDNCFIHIPFTGSGITMYVFNAGTTGMAASFSVDGNAAVSHSIAAPTAAENYQVSNISLYHRQGLSTGKHMIKMTLIDWNGEATDMKFDYAHVNETFVATPTSNRIGMGGIVGITLGVAAIILGVIVIGVFLFRKRRALHRGSAASAPESFQIEQFTSPSRPPTRHSSSRSSHARSDENSVVSPLMRFAILRDAHAIGNLFSSAPIQRRQSVKPEATASVMQRLRHQPSYSADIDPDEELSAFLDPAIPSQHNLTTAQVETVRGFLADGMPADTVTRVIEAFVSEANIRDVTPPPSEYALSLESPPSYKTQDR